MLTDTHCHLTKEFFNDIKTVIKDAKDNGVTRFISSADSVASCYEMLDLANTYPEVYITLGIHPENCFDNLEELKTLVENNLNNDKFIAIGEIGLDYYYGKENKEKQLEVFEYQLKLAEEHNLPVVIHSRDATLDTINILSKYNLRGVIHCFSGSLETANQYIKMGFVIGVGGVMTFKNSKISEIIKEIPIDKLILETDSPFLAPDPFRGKTNEPKYIKNIVEYLADLKHIDISEIEEKTNKNIKDIFDI